MKPIYFSFLLVTSLLFSCKKTKDKAIQFDLPKDFVLEDLYCPSAHNQGSWVALAEGEKGIFYACDQRGDIYQFKMPAEGQVLDVLQVDSVDLPIGEAHGLLWAFNSLYVAVNKKWQDTIANQRAYGSGVYRLRDTDEDGQLDRVETLLKLGGAGEHGPHNFTLGPGGKDLYFIAGNHVAIPDIVKRNSRAPINWGEDNLFPPYPDARGHAVDIKAPGGWVARTDPEGKEWELISAGYRNPFDIAFNEEGELFTYDADMEWDIGMPWYRPTRICHVTSGSEYGWRTGSGKWPDYYPDNLPAVINLEQGSPTGILMGRYLDFPARYKRGLFIQDWSFGTIYFIDLKPDGSTYAATKEEFLSGTPLPLTNMIAGSDGHLYFMTGGRGLESHLYRLRYVGADSKVAEPTANATAEELRKLRRSIEVFHTKKAEDAIPLAWSNLDHSDRFIRYAARIALEHQAVEQWQDHFFDEKQSEKIIQSGIALARQGEKPLLGKIIKKLNQINWQTLSERQKLDLLRNYALLCIRMGMPEDADRQTITQNLSPYFPSQSDAINKELGQLLLFLKADGITPKLVQLLENHTERKTYNSRNMLSEEISTRSEEYGPLIREVLANMPPSEAIFYGVLLSHAETGWTDELREKYFQWFYEVLSAKGGLSFKPFMENVRQKALSHIPVEQKAHFQELSGVYTPTAILADLPQPIGPGADYNGLDIHEIMWKRSKSYQGSLADGKRAFQAAMCGVCHRMRGEGGNVGPRFNTNSHQI